MRLLNIAKHLQGDAADAAWKTRVFVGSDHLEGARILAERGLDVDVVRSDDVSDWTRRIEEFSPRVVLVDLPFVPAEFSENLCDLPANCITLVDSVSDLDPKTARLDTVISLLDEELPIPCARYHRGTNFAALHSSVTERLGSANRRAFEDRPLHVVLAYGTGDPLQLTAKTLEWLSQEPSFLSGVSVALKKEHQDDRFLDLVSRFPFEVEIITSPSDRLGELLERADVALVSGGITAYESSAMGAPTVVLCQNDRELHRMEKFERSGSIVLLGRGDKVSPEQFLRAISRLRKDPELRERLSKLGLRVADGKGLDRITGVIGDLLAAGVGKA